MLYASRECSGHWVGTLDDALLRAEQHHMHLLCYFEDFHGVSFIVLLK